jgi:hypothetical protein
MSKIYEAAESVESIARTLLNTYHPELITARIRYYFVSEGSMESGRPILGKARKMSGALQYLTDHDFTVEVALNTWNDLQEHQRKALVDHLLEYCTGEEDEDSGEMKWATRKPDVKEFATILSRHGAWNDGLVGVVRVAQNIRISEQVQEVVAEAEAEAEESVMTHN